MKHVTLALALIVAGGAAQAATCDAASGPQTISYELTQGSPDAVLNKVCVSDENDTKANIAALDPFGIDDWMLGEKVEDEEDDGDGAVSFASFTTSEPLSWSVLNPLGYESIMVTLVQGNSFAAFLLDTTKALAGFWDTAGPGGATGDISHASVWYSGEPTPAPIPLPAAAALLPMGIGALALFRRRKPR